MRVGNNASRTDSTSSVGQDHMSTQRKRFEQAWRTLYPNMHPILLDQSALGYRESWVDKIWQGFQLGEASGLEMAAELCDESPAPKSCTMVEKSLWDIATGETADAIKAFMAQGEI